MCGLVRLISIEVFGLAPIYVGQCENFHSSCNYLYLASMIKLQRCCAAHINRIGAFGQSLDGMGQLGANVVEPGYEKMSL